MTLPNIFPGIFIPISGIKNLFFKEKKPAYQDTNTIQSNHMVYKKMLWNFCQGLGSIIHLFLSKAKRRSYLGGRILDVAVGRQRRTWGGGRTLQNRTRQARSGGLVGRINFLQGIDLGNISSLFELGRQGEFKEKDKTIIINNPQSIINIIINKIRQ